MMAYNPAIGRVLQKGGVDEFADLMVDTIPKFYGLVTRSRFDSVHAETCQRIIDLFKTSRGGRLTYGQAQKPLNVFLKVYVDWAKRPDPELANKLTQHLHVPLDSLLMAFIAREFPEEYRTRVVPLRKQFAQWIAERLKNVTKRMADRTFGGEFSLTGIATKEIYLAWQELLRSLYPGKPIMLDVIWVSERARIRKERALGQFDP